MAFFAGAAKSSFPPRPFSTSTVQVRGTGVVVGAGERPRQGQEGIKRRVSARAIPRRSVWDARQDETSRVDQPRGRDEDMELLT